MDEAPAMEHLPYGKDELRSSSDIAQEDDLKTMSNAAVAAAATTDSDPFNDYLTDLQMESMRLSDEHPMEPERRSLLKEEHESATEGLAGDAISKSENRKSRSCDEDSFFGGPTKEEIFRKTHSPVQAPHLTDYQAEGALNSGEALQDEIELESEKSLTGGAKESRNESMAYDYDKFSNSFVNNNNDFASGNNNKVIDVDQRECDSDNQDGAVTDVLTAAGDSPAASTPLHTTAPNDESDAQYDRLAKGADDFELTSSKDGVVTSGTSGHQNDSSEILLKENALKGLPRKRDDVGKISTKLEAFSKNIEISSSPVKTSRSKIEDTEMPTKGVVSNLKSLFENNAVRNNNDAYKSVNYKLEYGVGRSAGTLNKGVFH